VPTLTVRDLDEAVYDGLKGLAREHHHSMEAEARLILAREVRTSGWVADWLAATAPWRGELPLPERSAPREVDLT
jgi:plasmid stability protein